MKNLIFLLGLAVLGFGVLGWFLDWYSLDRVENRDGKTSIQLQIDRNKIGSDVGKAKDKLDKTLDQFNTPSGTSGRDPWNWASRSGTSPYSPPRPQR